MCGPVPPKDIVPEKFPPESVGANCPICDSGWKVVPSNDQSRRTMPPWMGVPPVVSLPETVTTSPIVEGFLLVVRVSAVGRMAPPTETPMAVLVLGLSVVLPAYRARTK